jgi:3-oxoacyl-[acyl-carrier-protein] synthase III
MNFLMPLLAVQIVLLITAVIPLAMDALLESHPELSGGLALIIGYGAGLVYAGQVVQLP